MNTMKKFFAPASAMLGGLALFVNRALAVGDDIFRGGPDAPNVAAQGTLGQNITTIINYFLGILGLVAVAFLIYAGVLMVTAGGNEEAVTKAKKIIIYAVVGILIIVLSYTIVTFVSSVLG